MDINDLTLRQLKEISSLSLNNGNLQNSSSLIDYTGKYVIVRSRNEGINAGIVKAYDNTGIVLTEARRLYYHKPSNKDLSWYEGVAESGLSTDSKISTPREKLIIEDYSITLCSEDAAKSIKNHKTTPTTC